MSASPMPQRPSTGGFRRGLRRLRRLPVLPTLFTAGNLACGVTAILLAANGNVGWGSLLIFVAMFCDMLDGKLARMTGTDGAFGAELDSLADVVSFGVAPAMLMHRVALDKLGLWGEGERLVWLITVIYAVFTAIRLARYNVEHDTGPTTHFKGLPSPGAAAVLCSWIGCYAYLVSPAVPDGPRRYDLTWVAQHVEFQQIETAFRLMLPGLGMVLALLMVSTLPFPHVGNRYLGGKVRFRQLVLLLLVGGMLVVWHVYALVLVTTGYVLGSLVPGVLGMLRRWRSGHDIVSDDDDESDGDEDDLADIADDDDPALNAAMRARALTRATEDGSATTPSSTPPSAPPPAAP